MYAASGSSSLKEGRDSGTERGHKNALVAMAIQWTTVMFTNTYSQCEARYEKAMNY